jgi:hypothetical protein
MDYFYSQQFKRNIVQFMEIFRGVIVKTGKTSDGTIKDIIVPIRYGSMDRVAESISANNTQNLPTRLPIMSAYLSTISMASDRYKGIDTVKTMPYTPRGGLFPDDTKTINQVMPMPFKLSLDLHIYSSNMEQQLQILEQILLLFNPSIQIQTSNALYDGGRITNVELVGINNDENYPIGTDRRMVMHTLNFDMILYLTAPAKLRDNLIKQINIRISELDVTNADIVSTDLDDIILSINDVIG